jgi:hypothetical protein
MDNFYKNLPGRMNDSRMFTDYRTSNRRELSNMSVNGIINEHDYRFVLQNNGSEIMDAQWQQQKRDNTKQQKICPHNYPTRSNTELMHNELKQYTDVFTGKSNNAPKCPNLCDFRLTETNGYNNTVRNCSDVSN